MDFLGEQIRKDGIIKEGDRVILRTIGEQDRELLLGLIEDPGLKKVTGGYPHPTAYVHQMDRSCSAPEHTCSLYSIIAEREDPQIGLGVIILSDVDPQNGTAKIYIKLMRPARGSGYGRDAIDTLVSYAFGDLCLTHVYADILEENTASRRSFESCGFKQEGMQKSRGYADGPPRNVCIYGRKAEPHSCKVEVC